MSQTQYKIQPKLASITGGNLPGAILFDEDQKVSEFGRQLARLVNVQQEPSAEYECKCPLFDAIRVDRVEGVYSFSVVGHDPLVEPVFSSPEMIPAIQGLLRWIRNHSSGQN